MLSTKIIFSIFSYRSTTYNNSLISVIRKPIVLTTFLIFYVAVGSNGTTCKGDRSASPDDQENFNLSDGVVSSDTILNMQIGAITNDFYILGLYRDFKFCFIGMNEIKSSLKI